MQTRQFVERALDSSRGSVKWTRRASLQAGARRFDPCWLHWKARAACCSQTEAKVLLLPKLALTPRMVVTRVERT